MKIVIGLLLVLSFSAAALEHPIFISPDRYAKMLADYLGSSASVLVEKDGQTLRTKWQSPLDPLQLCFAFGQYDEIGDLAKKSANQNLNGGIPAQKELGVELFRVVVDQMDLGTSFCALPAYSHNPVPALQISRAAASRIIANNFAFEAFALRYRAEKSLSGKKLAPVDFKFVEVNAFMIKSLSALETGFLTIPPNQKLAPDSHTVVDLYQLAYLLGKTAMKGKIIQDFTSQDNSLAPCRDQANKANHFVFKFMREFVGFNHVKPEVPAGKISQEVVEHLREARAMYAEVARLCPE